MSNGSKTADAGMLQAADSRSSCESAGNVNTSEVKPRSCKRLMPVHLSRVQFLRTHYCTTTGCQQFPDRGTHRVEGQRCFVVVAV